MKWHMRLGYAVLISLVWLSTTTAIEVFEEPTQPDAGDLTSVRCTQLDDPARCARMVTEMITETDRMLSINGRISSPDDADMYEITISIPELFSATTIFIPGVVSIEDSQLFLFYEEGRGICANEDNPTLSIIDPLRRLAALPAGMCNILGPGKYFLAVSTSVRDPVDISGSEIFPDPITDAERQEILLPISPNAAVADWGDSSQRGDYVIQLTGVNYPEPECSASQVMATDEPGERIVSLQALDPLLGLESIEEVPGSRTENISEVIIPAFDRGANAVTVSAVDTNLFMADQVEVEVTSTSGLSITCRLSTPQEPEQPREAPSCVDVFSLEGLPAVETTVQDTQSGLRRIELVFLKNATVTVSGGPLPAPVELAYPPGTDVIEFNPPTTEPILIRAEKINLDERATVLVEVFDNDVPQPNSDICDPILFQLVADSSFSASQTYNDIPEFDHFISVQNGNGTPGSGLMELSIQVNDAPKRKFKLGDRQVIQLDVEAEMIPGLNSMTFEGKGLPGTQASIAVSNQQPEITSPAFSGFILRRSGSSQRDYTWGASDNQ